MPELVSRKERKGATTAKESSPLRLNIFAALREICNFLA